MNSATFSVRGIRPKPWGTKEWNWRRAIAAEAIKVQPSGNENDPRQICVHLTFHLVTAVVGCADLDNLAKPVLDTLFHAKRVQTPEDGLSGVLFSCDDGHVYQLHLKKQSVSSETDEGIDAVIEWET